MVAMLINLHLTIYKVTMMIAVLINLHLTIYKVTMMIAVLINDPTIRYTAASYSINKSFVLLRSKQ